MELSRHNILSRIHRSDDFFLVNVLSGNADILTSAEARRVIGKAVLNDPDYISKGYVVDPDREEREFRSKYLEFLDSRDTDEIQLFYVPSYSCNFNCSYCYQEGYLNHLNGSSLEAAEAFFSYIRSGFPGRKKYITLFGGEPLLTDRLSREFLDFTTGQCRQAGLDLAVVTNGYNLQEFIPVLLHARIREIQVTLDGPERVHNIRRPLKNGWGTFSKIVKGIDSALEAGLPVNLRVVLDRDNIAVLPEMAAFAIDKGWTRSPLFKTQMGRNYELHYCHAHQANLYSRIDLYRDLYNLIFQYPHMIQFHRPAYSLSNFIFKNGELPSPLFDSCPGCKTEWAFDYTGRIFACTATVGKPGEDLGTFFPNVALKSEQIEHWQQRDVLSIEACRTCNLRLACGGGCASVAFNREKNLHAPDCRPVQELMELGFSLYQSPVTSLPAGQAGHQSPACLPARQVTNYP
jgi:uncharacterized protein